MFNPFEKQNLIFIDTEFSDLDPYKGELLSVGIVKLTGEEFYIELEYTGESHKWVVSHILPTLTQPKLNKEQAKELMSQFLNSKMPFAVGFIDNYDVIYMTKLFGAGNLPFKWQTIDFASILFGLGIDPRQSLSGTSGPKAFYRSLGIDTEKYKKHNALDDAKMLRDAWLALCKDVKLPNKYTH